MAGSLDGRVRRVRRLEARARERGTSPTTSRTLKEVRALEAEIRKLERELRAEVIDPDECLRGVDVSLPLDQHIAMLVKEIGRCSED